MPKPGDKERKQQPESKIKLGDLMFYFDSQERDRLDFGRLGRKSGQVLALREKLMKLPGEEFEATMKSIEAIVAVTYDTQRAAAQDPSQQLRRKDAMMLFEKASKEVAAEAPTKTDRISRV